VRLEIARGAKSLPAVATRVRLLACVNKQMFLEVSQLGEGLRTHLTPERALSRVSAQMHLEVAELAKHLLARLTPVLDLAVLLLEGVGEGLVARAANILLDLAKHEMRESGGGSGGRHAAVTDSLKSAGVVLRPAAGKD